MSLDHPLPPETHKFMHVARVRKQSESAGPVAHFEFDATTVFGFSDTYDAQSRDTGSAADAEAGPMAARAGAGHAGKPRHRNFIIEVPSTDAWPQQDPRVPATRQEFQPFLESFLHSSSAAYYPKAHERRLPRIIIPISPVANCAVERVLQASPPPHETPGCVNFVFPPPATASSSFKATGANSSTSKVELEWKATINGGSTSPTIELNSVWWSNLGRGEQWLRVKFRHLRFETWEDATTDLLKSSASMEKVRAFYANAPPPSPPPPPPLTMTTNTPTSDLTDTGAAERIVTSGTQSALPSQDVGGSVSGLPQSATSTPEPASVPSPAPAPAPPQAPLPKRDWLAELEELESALSQEQAAQPAVATSTEGDAAASPENKAADKRSSPDKAKAEPSKKKGVAVKKESSQSRARATSKTRHNGTGSYLDVKVSGNGPEMGEFWFGTGPKIMPDVRDYRVKPPIHADNIAPSLAFSDSKAGRGAKVSGWSGGGESHRSLQSRECHRSSAFSGDKVARLPAAGGEKVGKPTADDGGGSTTASSVVAFTTPQPTRPFQDSSTQALDIFGITPSAGQQARPPPRLAPTPDHASYRPPRDGHRTHTCTGSGDPRAASSKQKVAKDLHVWQPRLPHAGAYMPGAPYIHIKGAPGTVSPQQPSTPPAPALTTTVQVAKSSSATSGKMDREIHECFGVESAQDANVSPVVVSNGELSESFAPAAEAEIAGAEVVAEAPSTALGLPSLVMPTISQLSGVEAVGCASQRGEALSGGRCGTARDTPSRASQLSSRRLNKVRPGMSLAIQSNASSGSARAQDNRGIPPTACALENPLGVSSVGADGGPPTVGPEGCASGTGGFNPFLSDGVGHLKTAQEPAAHVAPTSKLAADTSDDVEAGEMAACAATFEQEDATEGDCKAGGRVRLGARGAKCTSSLARAAKGTDRDKRRRMQERHVKDAQRNLVISLGSGGLNGGACFRPGFQPDVIEQRMILERTTTAASAAQDVQVEEDEFVPEEDEEGGASPRKMQTRRKSNLVATKGGRAGSAKVVAGSRT